MIYGNFNMQFVRLYLFLDGYGDVERCGEMNLFFLLRLHYCNFL